MKERKKKERDDRKKERKKKKRKKEMIERKDKKRYKEKLERRKEKRICVLSISIFLKRTCGLGTLSLTSSLFVQGYLTVKTK